MSHGPAAPTPKPKPIPYLRWWIGGLLFMVTVINYIDRQSLSVLAPVLKKQYGWDDQQYALISNSFTVAYTIMQSVYGRVLDLIGTGRGLAISVAFYSVIAALTACARGLYSFSAFRFLLGCGEAANNPGGSKTVSEWFPAKERAWAVALFDSGSSIGGAVAGFVVLGLYKWFGAWQPAFIITASLGFIWLFLWMRFYRTPETHPRLSDEEREYILAGRSPQGDDADLPKLRWRRLFRYRQVWGIVVGRFLLDPYWFLVCEWFPLIMMKKGFSFETSALAFWVPFIGTDLGNFVGGGLSGYLIKRGWPVGRARRLVLLIFGPSMLLLMPAAKSHDFILIMALFGWANFAYGACSTTFLTLPTDAFHTRAVGSVMGLGGTGAGTGKLITTFLIGWASVHFNSFENVIVIASIIPTIATVVFVTLVRANKNPDPDGIVLAF